MAVPSPLFLIVAAVLCSVIGRGYLVRAAMGISRAWGLAVLFVPFAPYFFRRNYKELAHEGKGWRTWAMICGLMFFAVTGSTGSFNDLWAIVPDSLRPASMRSDVPFLEHDDETVQAGPAKAAVAELAAVAPSTVAPATPVPPSYAERMATNQQEFVRLGEVYESLKLEKGYLRKHDDEGIRAYNSLAAKYQADLAKARAEQAELTKLVVAK